MSEKAGEKVMQAIDAAARYRACTGNPFRLAHDAWTVDLLATRATAVTAIDEAIEAVGKAMDSQRK